MKHFHHVLIVKDALTDSSGSDKIDKMYVDAKAADLCGPWNTLSDPV